MASQRLALAGAAFFLAAAPALIASVGPALAQEAGSVAPDVSTGIQQPALPQATAAEAAPVLSTTEIASENTAPAKAVESAAPVDGSVAAASSDTGGADAAAADAGETPAVTDAATDPSVVDESTAPSDGTGTEAVAAEPVVPEEPKSMVVAAYDRSMEFLVTGGPAIWAIVALSVITVALILWKLWRLAMSGAWSRSTSRRAVEAWERGEAAVALATVRGRGGVRSRVVHAAMQARTAYDEETAREETSRVARRALAGQGTALRALELISTVAPLLGLLGTVMGMISAFQQLQAAGSHADPALLAGGIWEALLTTAAGMAVAIPASAALTWFEAILDSLRQDLEDLSSRIFIAPMPGEGMSHGNITKLAAQ